MSGEGIESVDEKLTAAFERREQAQDDLIRALTAHRYRDDAHRGTHRPQARGAEEGGDVKREPMPEPWMFGTEVTVNGVPVQAQIMRFTLMGRLRIAWRLFRGRPAFRMTQIESE